MFFLGQVKVGWNKEGVQLGFIEMSGESGKGKMAEGSRMKGYQLELAWVFMQDESLNDY